MQLGTLIGALAVLNASLTLGTGFSGAIATSPHVLHIVFAVAVALALLNFITSVTQVLYCFCSGDGCDTYVENLPITFRQFGHVFVICFVVNCATAFWATKPLS